jgi:hypothetical protein
MLCNVLPDNSGLCEINDCAVVSCSSSTSGISDHHYASSEVPKQWESLGVKSGLCGGFSRHSRQNYCKMDAACRGEWCLAFLVWKPNVLGLLMAVI